MLMPAALSLRPAWRGRTARCRVNSGSMRLAMPASTLPGPHSTIVVIAARLDGLHAFDPAHRAEGLLVQSASRMRSGLGFDLDLDVVDHRNLRRGERRGRQLFPQLLGRRLHQARMERRRHRQRQRALGAIGLEHFAGLLDGGLAAGDHGLRRIVEVHRLHHFVACSRRSCAPPRRSLRSPCAPPCPGWPPSRPCPPAPPPAWPARGSAPAARPAPA